MLDKNMLETSKRNAILINYSEDENKENYQKELQRLAGNLICQKIFNGFIIMEKTIKK